MSKRNEPVRKTVKETLADLLAGHREAAFNGPVAAQKYLDRTLAGQQSLPNAVKAVVFDRLAEARAQLQDWAGVIDAVAGFLKYLPDMEAGLGHGYREALEATTALERGVQARSERGEFHEALELSDLAIGLNLGAHWSAKRDSLDWAR